MTVLLVVLYSVGGALELLGLAVVAIDIRQAQARAKEITERPVKHLTMTEIRSGGKLRDPKDLDRLVRMERSNQEHAIREARADMLDVLVGHRRRRLWGLAALMLGLFISVAGNIVSVFA